LGDEVEPVLLAIDLAAQRLAYRLGLGGTPEGRKFLGQGVDLRILDEQSHGYPI